MMTKLRNVMMMCLLCALGATAAWSQTTQVTGKVVQDGKPLPNVQLIYHDASMGRQFKTKTDNKGEFVLLGIPLGGHYVIEVYDPTGRKIFEKPAQVTGDPDTVVITVPSGPPPMTNEEIEKAKAANAKATNLNTLITQVQTAMNAKDWQGAVPILQQMIAIDGRWDYYQALANAQLSLGQYEEAAQSADKGIQAGQTVLGSSQKAAKGSADDPDRVKAGVGQMLATEGNAYIKLGKTDKAIEAFTKAAEMDPNPGVAYFNLCATQYNMGQMKAASVACDKAIAADPNKADAYFIKGSAMYGDGKLDANNKYVVPPGTTEALNKYLQLAPDGPHAGDVKAMLEAAGAKIETSYGKKKK